MMDYPGLRQRIQLEVHPALRRLPAHFAVAIAYFAAAELGMWFMLPDPAFTLIVPASGVALALLYRLGYRYAPAVAVGALAFQLHMGVEVTDAVLLATGQTAAPLLGAWLLRTTTDFTPHLTRIRDVLALILVGGVVASGVSSAAGALALAGIGRGELTGFTDFWWVCWVADMMGILVVAPLLMTWRMPRRREWPAVRMAEFAILLALVAVVGIMVYGDRLASELTRPLSYAVFPLMIWVATRFTPRETGLILLGIAAIAVPYTVAGTGPFIMGSLRVNLLSLHGHLGLVALTGLLLCAAVAERARATDARREAEAQARRHLQELGRVGRISAMGEMAGGLAHELNQPLCAIMSFSQACRRLLDSGGAGSDDMRKALDRVVANADRAGTIVRQMRAFVGNEETVLEVTDVNALIRDVHGLTASDAGRHNVRIQLALASGLPPVEVSPIQIEQVLVNLIRNAVEAMDEGDATAEDRIVRLESRLSPGGKTIEVDVLDTGPGIPEAMRERLFEPFVTQRSHGLGLGLSISRSIMAAHGGHISLEPSEANPAGARFRVCLPIAREGGVAHVG